MSFRTRYSLVVLDLQWTCQCTGHRCLQNKTLWDSKACQPMPLPHKQSAWVPHCCIGISSMKQRQSPEMAHWRSLCSACLTSSDGSQIYRWWRPSLPRTDAFCVSQSRRLQQTLTVAQEQDSTIRIFYCYSLHGVLPQKQHMLVCADG